MLNPAILLINVYLHLTLIQVTSTYYTIAIPDVQQNAISYQTSMIKIFPNCTICVINFRGLNLDFQVLKEPALLLRYIPSVNELDLFRFELASKYLKSNTKNWSTLHNAEKTTTS